MRSRCGGSGPAAAEGLRLVLAVLARLLASRLRSAEPAVGAVPAAALPCALMAAALEMKADESGVVGT